MSDYFIKSLVESVLEAFDKKPATTLDANYNVVAQLSSSNVKIMVNSSPLADKRQFTEYWLKLPLTQHRLQSYDYHIVPGLNLANVVLTGKVRFDESGRNRLNETADLIDTSSSGRVGGGQGFHRGSTTAGPRAIWGSWFGFTMVLVVDATNTQGNVQQECINGLNYKINFIAQDSVIQV